MGQNNIINLAPAFAGFAITAMLFAVETARAQPQPEGSSASLQQALNFSRGGDHQKARGMYLELLSSEEIQQNAELHAYVLRQLAETNLESGAYDEAAAKAGEALANLSQTRNTEVATYAIAQGITADALWAHGNYGQAKIVAEAAVRLGRRTLGPLAPRYESCLPLWQTSSATPATSIEHYTCAKRPRTFSEGRRVE